MFSDKNSDIFRISAQNIDCGYSLEPPRRGGSNVYPLFMVLNRNKKNNVYPFVMFAADRIVGPTVLGQDD